jgi:hypothetical protein
MHRASASGANRRRLAGSAALAASAFVLTWAAGKALDIGVSALWSALPTSLAVIAVLVTLAGLSLSAAVLAGRLRLPARTAQIWLGWAIKQLPYTARDLLRRLRVGRGRGNRRWPSLADFEGEDPRRLGGPDQPQCDYGVHWRDRDGQIRRVTHIVSTGEVVAVVGRQGPVELLATIPSEQRLAALLEHYEYVSMFDHDIRWVRRRLAGWNVPLPPVALRWLEEDRKPPKAWPTPPPPSVGRDVGAYHGRPGDGGYEVTCVDAGGERPLYHAVHWSPTGYSWGYSGAGPTDMAASLLLDRLGYVPQRRIVYRFRDDVVAVLSANFMLTYADVDAWIDEHAGLFAENPRAVPLDPFAAGGAYDDAEK